MGAVRSFTNVQWSSHPIFIVGIKSEMVTGVCAQSLSPVLLFCCYCCLVMKLCPTPCNPMDCSPPGYSVHEILQARVLEWIAMPSSMGPSPPRDQTHISCIARQVHYH